MFNIPVKQTIKHLGIHITKDVKLRQQLNFLNSSHFLICGCRETSPFLEECYYQNLRVYQGLFFLLCHFFLMMLCVKKSIVNLLILFGKIDTTISRKTFLSLERAGRGLEILPFKLSGLRNV